MPPTTERGKGVWGAFKLIALLLLAGLLSSCAYTVSTPPITRLYPEGLNGERRILITGFRNSDSNCLQEEITAYLAGSKTFVPIKPPEGLNERQLEKFIEEQNVKLVLSGDVEKNLVNRSPEGFNTVRVVAVISAKMVVVDTHTDDTIWSLKDSIALNGYGQGFVSEKKAKETGVFACKNLATKMLNDFAKNYATYDRRR
jgi:hypothetical protein